MNPFQSTIKKYLDKFARKDQEFAKKYSEPTKSIEACCRYIISEVRKTKREAFADEEIYGMAIHYYDEKSIVAPDSVPHCNVVVPREKKSSVGEARRKKVNRRKDEAGEGSGEFVQGLLFGSGEVEE